MASGFSSSGVAELALFQEMHSYSTYEKGHGTLLVPLAIVKGTGARLFFLFLLVDPFRGMLHHSNEAFFLRRRVNCSRRSSVVGLLMLVPMYGTSHFHVSGASVQFCPTAFFFAGNAKLKQNWIKSLP